MAYEHGQVYDSYLAVESEREWFWSADRRGVLSYVRLGRQVKVGGGLLAPADARETLLREFLEMCGRRKWSVAFFTITDEDVALFQSLGCVVTKWGEDPIVDLADWSSRGKSYEWLRRQENYCRRRDAVCTEWLPLAASPDELHETFAEIEEVSREWLADKPQARPLGFFNGEPDFGHLSRQRVFLVRADGGQGRLEAFVFASPFQGGEMWALDVYRHRTDAVRGAVAFAMLHALRELQASGVRAVSLCMVATLGCDATGHEGKTIVTRLLAFGGRCLSPMFDLAGMYHFKSRFRPRFEPRYLCVWPRASLMNTLTNFYLTGVTNFSIRKVVRRAWSQWRTAQRRTLATYSGPDAPAKAA
jgi:phosphatidylglycerol lysyltransferase